jgi:hypothetical protein
VTKTTQLKLEKLVKTSLKIRLYEISTPLVIPWRLAKVRSLMVKDRNITETEHGTSNKASYKCICTCGLVSKAK